MIYEKVRYIYVNSVDEAERFIKMYGGYICNDDKRKVFVMKRFSDSEMDQIIKALGLTYIEANDEVVAYMFE